MPREYQNALGQIVLDYSKAIQESVFEQLRVVRDGHLRIVFNPDLKISSWEFCARRHEELVPRRVIIPQVSQLGAVVQRYQAATQNAPSGLPIQDLQNTCNSFVASARQLAKALEVPLVNDLGYTKRYVRCLQISEVVNSMKDLIDHSKETGVGPIESLINFPGRQQQIIDQNANHNNPSSMHAAGLQISAASNDVGTNNSLDAASSLSASAAAIVGTPQNSMNTEQEKQMNSLSNPYAGNNVQIPSASSSNSVPPFKPSCSNNPVSISQNATHLSTTSASLAMLQENDVNDSQSSVQQILQELMMSSQLNDVNPMETDMKPINGMHPTLSAMAPSLNAGTGFTALYGTGTSASASGMRAAMTTNGMVMNGRHGTIPLPHDPTAINRQSQDLNNQLLDRLEAVNKFDNLQFDWKSSP